MSDYYQKWIYLRRDTTIQRTKSVVEARKLLRVGWFIISAAEFKRLYEVVERVPS